ncbi:hypothetical protein GCAAIG_10310 [Candidatus Electronema halotolerans]|jgi:hypothetical protein
MLAWIMKNKEWVFSGIGVFVLTIVCGWLWPKKNKGQAGKTGTYSVQQTNSGGGDNVGRDKISRE